MQDNKELRPNDFLPSLPESSLLPALQEHRDLIAKSIVSDWSIPEFKLKHFVANSQIHPLHKVKQMMIELNSRQEAVESFNDEKDKLAAEIELEEEMKSLAQFEGQKKLHDIEIRKKKRSLDIAREKTRSLLHEREKFLKAIDRFNVSEEGTDPETGKLYMDILSDPEHCERIEAKYWEYRLGKQAAMDMIAYGRIGVGNMEAILQLDADSQNKCLAMAYEVVITNEQRMNIITDGVQKRLEAGLPVSDITKLVGIQRTETLQLLSNDNRQEQNVPLIQKY